MADKLYTERTGGAYIRDPATGRRTRVVEERPAPVQPAPDKKDDTADAGKGKKS